MKTKAADTLQPDPKALRVVATARKALGIPYVWGGTNYKKGVDCSGLTYVAFNSNGIKLPRTSQEQFTQGTKVAKGTEIAGDLVFSYPESGGPGHVVLAIGNGKCIAAQHTGTSVGIFDLSIFNDVYVGSKRIIPAVNGGNASLPSSDSGGSSGSGSLASSFGSLVDTHTWYRVGQFLLGCALLVAGILIITKQSPISVGKKIGTVAAL